MKLLFIRPHSRISILLSIIVTGLFAAQQSNAQDASDHTYTSEAILTGLGVYNRICALCHGPNGASIDGVNLSQGVFRTAVTDDDLRAIITDGSAAGRMPSFVLSEEDMNGIIAYIRAGFDPEGIASSQIGDPVRGKELFEGKGKCSTCHRVNGVGPRTAPDLSNIGALRSPTSLQRNIVDPAAALLPINRPVRMVTRNEEVIVGRRLNEDTFSVQVIDSNERLRSVRKSNLLSYEISEVPSKQPTTLSEDEVADVVGYLLTLRGEL